MITTWTDRYGTWHASVTRPLPDETGPGPAREAWRFAVEVEVEALEDGEALDPEEVARFWETVEQAITELSSDFMLRAAVTQFERVPGPASPFTCPGCEEAFDAAPDLRAHLDDECRFALPDYDGWYHARGCWGTLADYYEEYPVAEALHDAEAEQARTEQEGN